MTDNSDSPMNIDKSILAKAASELHEDVGSLRDLPLELRETIASLYYEYWWIQLSLEPSAGHPSWTEHMVTRMGLYGMVPELVKLMREIRKEDRSIFKMTIGTTLDLLRYNLKNVTGKVCGTQGYGESSSEAVLRNTRNLRSHRAGLGGHYG